MTTPSIYWHDYETFGADPAWDRPAQFAGVRTNEALEIIGEPLVLYCKPANDRFPTPLACLITGITPQLALEKGMPEAEFIAKIHRELTQPGTCGAGYNSIRFDDEVTRNCLYRNFYDPYAREWRNGNSRWDIIDLLRLTRALRPEPINWPDNDQGLPSFRLEEITRANGIEHHGAHDALVDVYATIAVARLVRERIPKLYSYLYQLRKKSQVSPLLNLEQAQPVLHVSSKYPAQEGCIALVAPLVRHPMNPNGILVYNLAKDPSLLIEGGIEEIRLSLFTPRQELSTKSERVALKTVHLNKCPVVVPLKTLRDPDAKRLGIDPDQCMRNRSRILAVPGIREKIAEIFSRPPDNPCDDPDLMIYSGGFFSEADREKLNAIRTAGADALAAIPDHFEDRRLPKMLFRYRARNFPESLSELERQCWENYRMQQLRHPQGSKNALNPSAYRAEIQHLRKNSESFRNSHDILDALEAWADRLLSPDPKP